MGYDIKSFYALMDSIPKPAKYSSGEGLFNSFLQEEQKRYPEEAFFGMKVENLISKVCKRPYEYQLAYAKYKEASKVLHEVYSK